MLFLYIFLYYIGPIPASRNTWCYSDFGIHLIADQTDKIPKQLNKEQIAIK